MSETPRVSPPQHAHNYHPRYRPDIDGLRALSILAVVAYHFYPSALLGGFAGVDVFFVISGFLISRIIMQSVKDGAFSLADFYAHRIRRIFPALIVVLAACLAFGWFALLPDEFAQFGKHLAASAAFVQNFALWHEAGYFDTEAGLKPLLHLWSLAVEEQFYLLYPLLFLVAWRARLRVLTFLAVVGLPSIALTVLGGNADPAKAFFLPHTRYWELVAGAVLAYLHHLGDHDPMEGARRLVFRHALGARMGPGLHARDAFIRNLLGMLGLFLMLYSFLAIDRSVAYPGPWTLLPVLGGCLSILAGGTAWVNATLLAWRPVVFIGRISYPLYLWHWPLLAFARIMDESPAWALPLSFVLASLTYLLVERPLRARAPTLAGIVFLCALMAALGGAGYFVYSGGGLPQRAPIRELAAYQPENFEWQSLGLLRDDACYRRIPGQKASVCKIAKDAPPTVLLLGDSHANALFPGLAEATATEPKINVANVAVPGRAPLGVVESGARVYSERHRREDLETFERILRFAETTPSVRTVILAGRGPLYLSGYYFDSWGGRAEQFVMRLPEQPEVTDNRDIWRIALRKTVMRLLVAGKQVIFVLDVPELNFNPKTICIEHRPLRFTSHPPRVCGIPREAYDKRSREYRVLTASVLKEFPAVTMFDAAAPLCDSQICWAMKDGRNLYRDGDHVSLYGSRLLGRQLARLIEPVR